LTEKVIIELEWFETKEQAERWLKDFKEKHPEEAIGLKIVHTPHRKTKWMVVQEVPLTYLVE